MTEISGPSEMLAANADRERAIDVLKAGFAEGRLTKDEYDDRAARVHAARTYGQLGALIADLPTGPLGDPAHYPGAGYPLRQPARRPTRRSHGMVPTWLALGGAGIGLIAAVITGLFIAVQVPGHGVHSVVVYPVPAVQKPGVPPAVQKPGVPPARKAG
jgi:hypothetical protein